MSNDKGCVRMCLFIRVPASERVCVGVKLGQARVSFSHSPDTNNGFCAAGRSNSLAYL